MTDMHRLDFTRGTVEPIDPAVPPKGDESPEGTALDALKAAERAKGAHDRLTDIIGYLIDQAEQDDVDGAEWDSTLRRKLAQDLAKRFG